MTEPSIETALNKTLYALVKQANLTPEEISQLKLANLKLAGQHPTINVVSPDTNQQKTVELDLDTHRALVGWLVVRPDTMSDLLFPGEDDEPITLAEIEQVTAKTEQEHHGPELKSQPEPPLKPTSPAPSPTGRPARPSFANVPPPPPMRPGPFQTRPIKPPPAPPERGAPKPGVVPPPRPESNVPPPPEADDDQTRAPFTPGPSRPVARPATPPPTDLPAPESAATATNEPGRTEPTSHETPPLPLHRVQPRHKARPKPQPVRRRGEDDLPDLMPQASEPVIPPVNVKPAGTISSITAEEAAQIDAVMTQTTEVRAPQTTQPPAGPLPTQGAAESPEMATAEPDATMGSNKLSTEPATAQQPESEDGAPTGSAVAEIPAQPAARTASPRVTTDEPKPPRWYRPEPGSPLPGPLGRTERPMAMSFGVGGIIVLLALCGVCVTAGWILDAQSEDGLLVDLGLADPAAVVVLPEDLAPTEETAPGVEPTVVPDLVEQPVSAVATPTLPPTNTPTPLPPTDTPVPTETPIPTDTPLPTETFLANPYAWQEFTPTDTPTPLPTDTPVPIPTPEPVTAPPEQPDTPEPVATEEPGFKFNPPTLLGPMEDEIFVGNNQPTLQWQPLELGEGEYYAVRLVYPFNGQTTYGGINTTETQWTVPLQLYQRIDPPLNRYEWYVIIERSQDGGGVAISPESERRHFVWR